MIQELHDKITACRIEIEALKEEKQIAIEDFGHDGKVYDRWIEEKHQEISRLYQMIRNLQV